MYWAANAKSSKLLYSQLWPQFLQLRMKAWKIQDINGVWTCDFAIPVQRSNQLQCMIHFIYHFIVYSFILHGLIRTHKWPLFNVSGVIAKSVRASHRTREATGSIPVEILNYSVFHTQLRKLRSQLRGP